MEWGIFHPSDDDGEEVVEAKMEAAFDNAIFPIMTQPVLVR